MEVQSLGNKKIVVISLVCVAFVAAALFLRSESGPPEKAPNPKSSGAPNNTVELSQSQLSSIKIEPVGTHEFPVDKETVGTISFADDLTVQVFPPFQGRIIHSLVELGDHVQKGEPLYTIDSPDLIQAESSLISTSGVFQQTSRELARARGLNHDNGGVSEREVDQATAEQQTAEGAMKAARDAVRVFGKTDAEMDQIVATRKVDRALIVRSPIAGQVTTFNAPPGLFVQPGNGTAPYTVANVTVKWMLASIAEQDIALYHVGQPVAVKVMAYPDRVFQGRLTKLYASVDPTTHRTIVRSEISDPKNELRAGMLANFTIRVQKPAESAALPANGVVREGDGTMTAWVTSDRRHFTQRIIKTGLRDDGWVQVLDGLQRGELAVSDGAVFLSNLLNAPPSD